MDKHHTLKAELAELQTVEAYREQEERIKLQKKKVKSLKRSLRENYVKRGMVKKIVAAWVITVPAAAILSAMIFYIIKGIGA